VAQSVGPEFKPQYCKKKKKKAVGDYEVLPWISKYMVIS
jgi:hypothetical protein